MTWLIGGRVLYVQPYPNSRYFPVAFILNGKLIRVDYDCPQPLAEARWNEAIINGWVIDA